ncbi:TIGR03089 family protein [Nocardioides sp. InS609-2]|uniref:TIGR03089 family protein n=1 Tax=Nocardioides sp. InS609-2 TaxID=2760705 RepID=UPI0020BDD3E0|nr:TIGR03089 family protein [Nocardioides sp. InS609-2]
MTTFSTVLRDQLARDAGRPLVTFYGETPGERIELSVTTYANWVAKAAGLLVEECDLERGQSLRIDLPTHWLGPVFLGAAWTIGLVVTTDDAPDAVICGPETLADWADRADDLPVLACSLLPLGGRFAEGVPPGVHDVGAEIWGQPDAFTAWDPPGPDDRATDVLTQAELFAPTRGTAAVGSSLTDGGRLLTTANPASPPDVAAFTEPLARGGSVVLVARADSARLDLLYVEERATTRA